MYFEGDKMKKKKYYVILVILVLLGISIGYAVMNRKLLINGSSGVRKNTWNLRFENVVISEGSVEETLPTIDNNNLSVDFSFSLHIPGDFYEFTVDLWNRGTIDAMIDSITKTPDLTEEQKKYLNYTVEYYNGDQITSKHALVASSLVRLKVRIELKRDVNESDLPTDAVSHSVGFTVNYVQADESSVNVDSNISVPIFVNGNINDIGTIVEIGTEKFYTIGTDGDNVKLLSMYNLYVGYECPFDAEEFDSCTKYGDEATGMQNNEMIGFDASNNVYRGVTPFTVEELISAWPSDYVGSLVEDYVYEYKDKLEKSFYLNIEDATILSKNDLINEQTFACSESSPFCQNSPYSWIYSTSYWMKDPYYGSDLYLVKQNGEIDTSFFNYIGYGVRPVIIISKDKFI